MNCPSCNQTAIPFYRFTLIYRLLFPSSTGVSFKESIKGNFKCQNCGTILHIAGSQKTIWIWIAIMLAFIVAYLSMFRYIINVMGSNWGIALFIILLFVISVTIGFISWKIGRIEKIL